MRAKPCVVGSSPALPARYREIAQLVEQRKSFFNLSCIYWGVA